jgi:hypothetical protein
MVKILIRKKNFHLQKYQEIPYFHKIHLKSLV